MKFNLFHVSLLALSLIASAGCASGIKGTVKELAKDNATVVDKHELTTPWGTTRNHLIRANPATNQSVIISPDGTVTIKAGQ